MLFDQILAEDHLVGESGVMEAGVSSKVNCIYVYWLGLALEKPIVTESLANLNGIRLVVQVSCVD